jgi:hypothetical protein
MINDKQERIRAKAKQLLANAKYRAEKKNLAFDLDLDWVIRNLSPMKCQISTLPIDITHSSVMPNSPSIDKINPFKGYTKDNCRVILNCLNMVMSNHTENNPIINHILTKQIQLINYGKSNVISAFYAVI